MNKIKISIAFVILITLLIPLGVLADVTSYTSGFQVQNLSSTNTANITIDFYNQDGSVAASVPDTIAANDSNTYFPLNAVAAGFNGSVIISSDQAVAAVVNVLGNDGAYGAAYNGFSSGAISINLPLVMKNNVGIDTWFNIQNTGSTTANISITYPGTACTESGTIAPSAAQTYDQATNSCLPAGHVGSATITSDQPIVAAVMQVTSSSAGLQPNLLAYNGFLTESTNPVMPLVSSGWYGSVTGIQIQNLGAVATSVTLTYTPSAGFPGATCTETHSISAGQSETFGLGPGNLLPPACRTLDAGTGFTAFVGAAVVSSNSASTDLVAIVNQINSGDPQAAAYDAFNPADGTDKVSLPLIMDRNYGIFTGIAVGNLGTNPTDINCTFTGTSYTASKTAVQPGEALTDVQLNSIADGYVGSAVCISTGEPIAAVINQFNTGTVIPVEDGLLVSEGISY